jgi:hypothetical protein
MDRNGQVDGWFIPQLEELRRFTEALLHCRTDADKITEHGHSNFNDILRSHSFLSIQRAMIGGHSAQRKTRLRDEPTKRKRPASLPTVSITQGLTLLG